MTVWFDVEDLYDYVRAGHTRVTGIQRLTLEIYRAAAVLGGVGFVRHVPAPELFRVVPWAEVEALFQEAPAPRPQARPTVAASDEPAAPNALWLGARRVARRTVKVLPDRVRGPLVLAGVMQVQAVAQAGATSAAIGLDLLRQGAVAAARPVRRFLPRPDRHRLRAGTALRAVARPGDTLLVLGSPWFRMEYGRLARWVRDELRIGFGVLMHDLIPVRHPEWCDDGIRQIFRAWYSSVLPFCDLVLANSRHTARDLENYAREINIHLPRPVRVVPIGTGFTAAAAAPPPVPAAPEPEEDRPFVLFVSTMEARKNHVVAVEAWRTLLEEERTGVRPRGSVPDLVFAGRVGWLVADLIQELENSAWLNGRVRMIHAPSDAQLATLYERCLFTLFPSLHEGWGLPVTESLAHGAPCICSDAASLPEAGGSLCRYFDPESVSAARDAIAAVLDDPAGLQAWREQVRRTFRPVPWADTARAVLDEAALAMGVRPTPA